MCEIIFCSLEIKIVKRFSNLDDWSTVMSEIIFNCFQDNLCVYTGHLDCGFKVLSTDSFAYLHPLSILCYNDSIPQFLIFDHIIFSDKDYLMNVTAIPNVLIMKGLENSTLCFDHDELFENTLTSRVIEPVGEELMNHVFLDEDGEKMKEIIEIIKFKTGNNLISIDLSVRKGCVYIYALPRFIESAYKALQIIMNDKFEKIINECKHNTYELKKDQKSVFFEVDWSKGAQVTSIKIKPNLQTNLSQNNNIDENFLLQTKKLTKLPYSLRITWVRRSCNGNALVEFSNNTDLRSIRKLSLKHIYLLGVQLFMQMSERKRNQLSISGLPPGICKKELKKELESLLPLAEIDNIELMYISPFETFDKRLDSIKTTIINICKNVIDLESSEVVITKPKPKDLNFEVLIKTNISDGLDSVAELISANFTENLQTVISSVFSVEIACNADLCKALQPRLVSTLTELQNNLQSLDKLRSGFDSFIDKQNKDTYIICASSSSMEVLKLVHNSINNLLEGDVLSSGNVKGIGRLFCHGGHVWLKGLEAYENLYIIEDRKRKIIRLYGSLDGCEQAKVRISKFLEVAEHEVMEPISLSTGKTKKKLLKAVIETYGVNLTRFIEVCEMQTSFLDIRACMLLLRGSRESIDKAKECIQTLLEGLDDIDTSTMLSQEVCPVCYCPAINLTFRLEHCGHIYCQACIQGLVEGDTFPIQCIANDCYKDVVLKDVEKILNDNPERIRDMLHKSVDNYLTRNVLNITYCPAPDCSMFFFKNEITGDKVFCPLCESDICIRCNCITHGGLSCEMYQASKIDPDYCFKVWRDTANCKQCPRCKTAIEKIEGCNHMTCKHCNCHFCWLCPEETATVYSTGNEVYTHINQNHANRLFDYN